MGMWMTIILLCSSPYAQSCIVITGNELVTTKERCFAESRAKATEAMKSPRVFQALPLCQIIPNKVLPEKGKDI
tara:strand:+ start:63 stop:284 length:222 start_codon:yes stop_codon:yes gene_type:complete